MEGRVRQYSHDKGWVGGRAGERGRQAHTQVSAPRGPSGLIETYNAV